MTRYEIVLPDDGGDQTAVPRPGETLDIGGRLWEVERVEHGVAGPRVHLVEHVATETEFTAHRRAPVALAAPTSFETELVYTLNDLSSRLNVLAGALNAYWGRGAA